MTDRELLTLAARAAGVVLKSWSDTANAFYAPRHDPKSSSSWWNSLTDPGDALRLAVRLGLHAKQFLIIDDGFEFPLGAVEVWKCDDEDPLHVEYLRRGDDRLAATMRAITSAAAEIGRRMPG